jgi:Zn-dependent M16 (insulinase) family peptidase
MTILHGFELIQDQHISELNSRARLYRHHRTGAQLLSMENTDENKVFGISFRTTPTDSTGIPHIMEHSVLCGSEKYPLKEPFVELIKGSLNTFLNAFTFPDKTCYPVASQNLQDFYNLIDVYMDAVLHPLIPPHVLQQEGWHYELEEPDAPLVFKGVVFNEMKGAYSNPDDLLGDRARQSLFPDNTYGVDSGGDPRHIPDLTYAQFKSFHDTFYHPSNSYIYFYGDDDPEQRLRLMDQYLQGFQAIDVDSQVKLQPVFEKPRRVQISYDPGEDALGKKGMLVVNWMMPEFDDPKTIIGVSILNHILIGTPASPLRKALIDSGLGEDLAGGGLDWMLRQWMFSTGLKGMLVNESYQLVDEATVESLILGTLTELSEKGIDPNTVAASLNTVEFSLRENNTGAFPRGLWLMLRALSTWLYDRTPLVGLAFEDQLNDIKARLKNGERYFENLIQEYFLENPHRTTLVMQPEPGLNQRSDAEEEQRLVSARERMSASEMQKIIEDTQWLKEIQVTPDPPEALATIPSLGLNDLDKENKLIPLEIIAEEGSQVLFHDLFTNGIVYLDVGMNLHVLPQELLPYAPLFGRALVQMGTEKEDFVGLLQRVGKSTGGIVPATWFGSLRNAAHESPKKSASWLFLRGKATMDKAGDLLTILNDILQTARLDNQERFRQIVLEAKADMEAALVPQGHRIVASRLRALFDEAEWASEQTSGVDHLFFLRNLAEAIDQDWPRVLEKLERMRKSLINRSAMLCNVTIDQANFTRFHPLLAGFLNQLPIASAVPSAWRPAARQSFEGLTIPAQVNYVGKGADLYQLGYPYDGSINVILNYLNATYMWERVRVQGGAYGGFATFNQRSGVFAYLSYRDPNLLSTLENYDQAAQFLRTLDLSQEELTKSIIGAIGAIDAYQLPDAKGFTSMQRYLAGENDAERQQWRDETLSATVNDFKSFAKTLEALNESGQVVVLGSLDAIEKANVEQEGLFKVVKVL